MFKYSDETWSDFTRTKGVPGGKKEHGSKFNHLLIPFDPKNGTLTFNFRPISIKSPPMFFTNICSIGSDQKQKSKPFQCIGRYISIGYVYYSD